MTASFPLVEELTPAPDPVEVFLRLRGWPHCLFLDSARFDAQRGRYSFVTADPWQWTVCPQQARQTLSNLSAQQSLYHTTSLVDLPPFQGGLAGLLSYELGSEFEPTVPRAACDDLLAPALALGHYDVVVAFDQQQQRAWLISQGLPALDPAQRQARAAQRLAQFRQQIVSGTLYDLQQGAGTSAPAQLRGHAEPLPGRGTLRSNFSEGAYLSAVQRAIEYVQAGDIFQVNLAQRLLSPARDDITAFYLRLRLANPAPFATFFDVGPLVVASASPERFLRIEQQALETRPIKGTRPRSPMSPEAALYAGSELRQSDKDNAENIMIVDLLRNDVSRICLPESVRVPQLCQLESYAFVQHLVSAVTGTVRPTCGLDAVMEAMFPGGSITGAPKVRAMQIIAELEGITRGPYCGCIGYWGVNGSSDWNLLIRTVTAQAGWWHFPVGGGIVADSQPRHEYQETWHKAEGIIRALQPSTGRSRG